MREKRAIRNVVTNIILQCVLAISGLVIPRLIMHFYGSNINGIVSSISQFIAYASLIELGIGNASIVALYSSISKNSIEDTSAILTAGNKMYFLSGYIYTLLVLGIAIIYPLLYREQIDYLFIFYLVLYIGAINAIDYFFLSKYKVLLTADQKYYILNIVRIVATLILIPGSILLLIAGKNILWVKGFAVITHIFEAIAIYIYVKRHYPLINFYASTVRKIKQRWNALIHQLCATVVYNTDIVVLTVFLPGHSLYEISVYSVYSMVLNLVSNMVSTLTTGINASFGDMFAKGEEEHIKKVFDIYEFFYFNVLFIFYSCFITLILPFVYCYTKGIQDVNYVRLSIGVLFAINGLAAQLKDASGTIINAAGRYKETQRYSIEEALLNIIISISLVREYGIVGVLIGTLISLIWMDIRYMIYACKNLIVGSGTKTITRICRNLFLLLMITVVELRFIVNPRNYGIWILEAMVIFTLNGGAILGLNLLLERNKVLVIKKYVSKWRMKTYERE